MKALSFVLVVLAGTAQSEQLRIATGGHFPPYIFNPATENATGLDKDLLDEMCARGGFDCVWVDLPMGDIFQALARGDVDVVTGGFGYSTERDALVDFTCPYVYSDENSGIFVTRQPDADLIKGRIGALEQSLYLDSMQRANRNVQGYPTEDAALDALQAGDIDAVFGSHNMLEIASNRGGLLDAGTYPTFSGGTAIAVSEDAPDLLVTLDALLADMSSDGTLGQLRMTWLGWDENETDAPCENFSGLA